MQAEQLKALQDFLGKSVVEAIAFRSAARKLLPACDYERIADEARRKGQSDAG